MFTLAYPWLLLLIVLPPILRLVIPPYSETRQAVRVPWFQRMAAVLHQNPADGAAIAATKTSTLIFFWLLWTLIVVALARPQYLEPPVSRVLPTRDLMLLVDLSGSMETADFSNAAGETVDRLTAVKEVLDDFLTRREGDRVGLIVFGNAAFVQVPCDSHLARGIQVDLVLHDFLENDGHLVVRVQVHQRPAAGVQLHEPFLNQGREFEPPANLVHNHFLFQFVQHRAYSPFRVRMSQMSRTA